MKKTLFSIVFIGLFSQTNAQNTGINTTNPKATLDVNLPANYASTEEAGISFPRLTGNQVRDMKRTDLKKSTIVYATDAATDLALPANAHATKITTEGFYYYDGAKWEVFTVGTKVGEWVYGTTTAGAPMIYAKRAKDGSQNIVGVFENGSLHIGKESDINPNEVLQPNAITSGHVTRPFAKDINKFFVKSVFGTQPTGGFLGRHVSRIELEDGQDYSTDDGGSIANLYLYNKFLGGGYRMRYSGVISDNYLAPTASANLSTMSSFNGIRKTYLPATVPASTLVYTNMNNDFRSEMIWRNDSPDARMVVTNSGNFDGTIDVKVTAATAPQAFRGILNSINLTSKFEGNDAAEPNRLYLNGYTIFNGSVERLINTYVSSLRGLALSFPTAEPNISSTNISDAYGILISNMPPTSGSRYSIYTNSGKNSFGDQVEIRTINANTSTNNADKIVVADASGVLLTKDAAALNFWGLKGNVGTTAGTNFIGTTDNQDLVFKRNNNLSGRISTLATSIGYQALISNENKSNNAFGAYALTANTTGSNNDAFGNNSLLANTTGTNNIAVGNSSLLANIGGDSNVAVGQQALQSNTQGSYNVAVGQETLKTTTSGNWNISLGHVALGDLTNGDNNIAVGSFAGKNQTGGSYNIVVGSNVEFPNKTGSYQLNIGNSLYGSNINDGNATNDLVGVATSSPNSTLQVAGSLSAAIKSVGIYTATASDYTLIATGGNITLPDPTTCAGRMYHIVYKSGTVAITNSIFVGGTAVTNFGLNSGSGGQALTVQSDGTSWYAISRL